MQQILSFVNLLNVDLSCDKRLLHQLKREIHVITLLREKYLIFIPFSSETKMAIQQTRADN